MQRWKKIDVERVRRELGTPYPTAKFAAGVFLRALGAITKLQAENQALRALVNETSAALEIDVLTKLDEDLGDEPKIAARQETIRMLRSINEQNVEGAEP